MRMRQLMLILILIAGLTLSIASPLYAAPPGPGMSDEVTDGGGDEGSGTIHGS